jgi:tetratricopeptide (TPR) repeat protein
MIRQQRGDVKGAREDYDTALGKDSNQPAAYMNRANIRFGQGDLDGAILDYEKALSCNLLDPEMRAALERGLKMLRAKR